MGKYHGIRRSVCLLIFFSILPVFLRTRRKFRPLSVPADVLGQCFETSRVDVSARCARCVHFVTIVKLAGRWKNAELLLKSLHISAATLRSSQKCFTLTAYTNAEKDSDMWTALVHAGGESVTIIELPKDLPPNPYTGINPWIELSRHKLDIVERYEQQFGRKGIWTDLDTIVVADLSCAYARAPNFGVSMLRTRETIAGPQGKMIKLNPNRLIYGDLWMADKALREQVRALERDGMPPPKLDVQDYFKVLMDPCDGSLIDLRSMVRSEGFGVGAGMCFGWDFTSHGRGIPTPTAGNSMLRVINGVLHCYMRLGSGHRYYPVGSLSWSAPSYKKFLKQPRAYFNTPSLEAWAKKAGIPVIGEKPKASWAESFWREGILPQWWSDGDA